MASPKTIYCPICYTKLGTWDGRTSTNLIVDCRKCKKRIVYHPCDDEIETKKIPQRNTSSGVTIH